MTGHELRDVYDDWWFDLFFHKGIVSVIAWIIVILIATFPLWMDLLDDLSIYIKNKKNVKHDK